MTTIVLVKGGETELNKSRLWQGQKSNLPLTEEGRNSAAALAEKISKFPFEVIVSSAQHRCFDTGTIVAEKLSIKEIIAEPNLDQRKIDPFERLNQSLVDNFYQKATGDLEKRSADEIFETRFVEGIAQMSFEDLKETYSTLTHEEAEFAPEIVFERHTEEEIKNYLIKGIESNPELQGRVKGVFCEIVKKYQGQTILVITHNDLIRTFIRQIKEKPITKDWRVNNHAFAVIQADSEGKYEVIRKEDFKKRKNQSL